MGIQLNLGIPQLIHKWGDARLRRICRKLREENADLEAKVEELQVTIRAHRRAARVARKRRRKKRANRG